MAEPASAEPSGKRQVFRLSRERRVTDIMDAARDAFREKGYEDALISDIALRAEVVEGSIYRYFDNKRDLFIKVIERWYHAMLSDYDRQLTGISGTRNRLRYMIWRHLATVHEEPALCRLMFELVRSGPEYSGTAIFELNRQYTRRTLDIVRQGMENGELRPGLELRLVRDMIYGCVEHRTWAYLRGEGDFSPDAVADQIVDLVLGGIHEPDKQPSASEHLQMIERLERAVNRLETQLDAG